MLCSWYPQTENVDSQKWSKFAKDYELIPGMQDPMRVAQVDLAMRRQFKKKDGTYDRGGKMTGAAEASADGGRVHEVSCFCRSG